MDEEITRQREDIGGRAALFGLGVVDLDHQHIGLTGAQRAARIETLLAQIKRDDPPRDAESASGDDDRDA